MAHRPDYPGAKRWVPANAALGELSEAVQGCRGCDLYKNATQAVFGAGSARAELVLIGEQPGDAEDREGVPFVGPAGRLLDKALEEAGIDRAQTYTTNTVKHFAWKPQAGGKRRIHRTPDNYEVAACRPWLEAELGLLEPEVVVALGATAAKALFGPGFRLTRERGVLVPWPPASSPLGTAGESAAVFHATWAMATIHPSAVLRATDREAARLSLVNDLRVAAETLVRGRKKQ